MDEILKVEAVVDGLEKISAYEFIVFISVIGIIIAVIFGFARKVYKFIEQYRKTRNEYDEKCNVIESHSEIISNLVNDDTIIREDMESIKTKMDDLYDIISTLRREQNLRELATLKDQIRQSYSYYSQKKQWNCMEKESLEELIKSYENCGGKNSFVHSVVEKEMYTWKIID